MHYKNEDEKQHIAHLIELSSGLPEKGLANKIYFYTVFSMNVLLYNESQAREEVESMRNTRKSLLEDLWHYLSFSHQTQELIFPAKVYNLLFAELLVLI